MPPLTSLLCITETLQELQMLSRPLSTLNVMSRVPQIVSRKKKRIFYGQADRKGVGVSPAGPDRLSDQGHHELSRKSDENKSS